MGCRCERCCSARNNSAEVRFPASLAIIGADGSLLLFDATPSLPQQLDLLRNILSMDKALPDTIFLTHAHVGHYAGLIYFGKEVASTKAMPVYCTSMMKRFLESNKPFSYLVEREEIRTVKVEKGKAIRYDGLHITPVEVPHRNEDADTMAYVIKSTKTVFYAPDFDHHDEVIDRHVRNSDVAILDGCFWSEEELSERPIKTIPHPTIMETIGRFKGLEDRIIFTHMNHTNPVLNPDGRRRSELEGKRFRIAKEGMEISL